MIIVREGWKKQQEIREKGSLRVKEEKHLS